MLCRFAALTPWSACALLGFAFACATPQAFDDDARAGSSAGGASGSIGGAAAGLGGRSPGTGGTPIVGGNAAGGAAGSSSGGSMPGGSSSGGSISGGSAGTAGRGGGGGQPSGGASSKCVELLPCLEDFEDSKADNWIADTAGDDTVGNWAVVADDGNHVYAQQTLYSDESWAIGGNLAWTDQRIEAKVRFATVTPDDDDGTIFIAARFRDRENYYFMYFRADGSLRIRKRVNGESPVDIVGTTRPGITPAGGTWYTLVFEVKGTTLSASINGMAVGTATDASLMSGGIGVGVVDAVAAFDDIRVSAP